LVFWIWSFTNILRYILSIRIDERIILEWIFKKWDGEAWTGLLWLRIGTGFPALVNAVMNLQVPQNAVNFLTS
jgi:hypothetical protein